MKNKKKYFLLSLTLFFIIIPLRFSNLKAAESSSNQFFLFYQSQLEPLLNSLENVNSLLQQYGLAPSPALLQEINKIQNQINALQQNPSGNITQQTQYDQPSFGFYRWEVGLPFFAKAKELTFFYPGSDVLARIVGGFVKWMLRISGLIMFITFVYAGILYATSSGNPKQQKDAQQRMIDAVIGFFLLFGFYIILNTINPDILSSSPKLGEGGTPSTGQQSSTGQPTSPQLPVSGAQQIANFIRIGHGAQPPYNGIPMSDEFPNGAYIDKNTADKLAQLAIILNDGWKVTEACVSIINTNQCKTTIDHLDECHLNGTCVDIGYGGDPGEAKRNNFKKKANQVGLNVLDEYLCPQYGSGFHVVPASQYACPSNNYCWSCAGG